MFEVAWAVCLSGDSSDLGMLAESFKGPEFAITKEEDEFLLTSQEFESLNDAGSIHQHALKFVGILNGAIRLALDSRKAVTVSAVYNHHRDGRRDVYIFPEPIVAKCRMLAPTVTVTRLDGTVETYHPADPVQDWMKIASSDGAAATALRLIGSGVSDWVNLYRIFDVVAADCGGVHGIQSQGWATRRAMRLFQQTANSPGAIGTEARHGAEQTTPPSKPMTLGEAKSLVFTIVQAWLRSKGVP